MDGLTESKILEIRQRYSDDNSATDSAYWTIRDAIRLGVISPGEYIMEVPLSKTLGVSRTPVRSALQRLETERFIESVPRKGFIIPRPTYEDILEVFELRECLDGFAANRAAIRLNDVEIETLESYVLLAEEGYQEQDLVKLRDGGANLHKLIRYGSKIKRLSEMLNVLNANNRMIQLLEYGTERVANAIAEHRQIYEAIAMRDSEKAESLMRLHVRNAFRAQIQVLGLLDYL